VNDEPDYLWKTIGPGDVGTFGMGAAVMDTDIPTDGTFFSDRPGQDIPILFGDLTPDVVRIPDDLGGGVVRVTSTTYKPCPYGSGSVERHTHEVLWHGLAHDQITAVAGCPDKGWLWLGRLG
jgi:hypothetical protein